MTAVSDAVVIGVVLGLVFAAVSYYLFTRISQLERKVSFMETILLELKVTTEQTLLSATEAPEVVSSPRGRELSTYTEVVEQDQGEVKQIHPFTTVEETATPFQSMDGETRELLVESTPRARSPQQPVQVERDSSRQSVTENFEAMTYKELQAYARERNISGIRNLSKKEVIDIIRRRLSGGPATGSASSAPDMTDLSSWKQPASQETESAFQPLQDADDLGAMVGSDETQPNMIETMD